MPRFFLSEVPTHLYQLLQVATIDERHENVYVASGPYYAAEAYNVWAAYLAKNTDFSL